MNYETAKACSLICRIFGNPLAYRIVCALGQGRRRPVQLADELGASASGIVNQLKIMKAAGLVRWHSTGIRRGGRVVEYWVSDRAVLRLCETAQDLRERIRKAE
jgi:predicted transcriptional regulator